MVGKIFSTVFILALGLGVAAFSVIMIAGTAQSGYTRFSGHEKFATMDEAYTYQQQIIDYADSMGYKSDVTISKHSPPEVEYSLQASARSLYPDVESDYGSRGMSIVILKMMYVLSAIVGLVVSIGTFAYAIGVWGIESKGEGE